MYARKLLLLCSLVLLPTFAYSSELSLGFYSSGKLKGNATSHSLSIEMINPIGISHFMQWDYITDREDGKAKSTSLLSIGPSVIIAPPNLGLYAQFGLGLGFVTNKTERFEDTLYLIPKVYLGWTPDLLNGGIHTRIGYSYLTNNASMTTFSIGFSKKF